MPIFGFDGHVRIILSVSRVADGPFAAPADIYDAVGRSGFLELVGDFQHSPAILRALAAEVASSSLTNAAPHPTRLPSQTLMQYTSDYFTVAKIHAKLASSCAPNSPANNRARAPHQSMLPSQTPT